MKTPHAIAVVVIAGLVLLLGKHKFGVHLVENPEQETREWPNTTPLDKTDPFWEFNNNATFNGVPYCKAETSPGQWQWVVNEEARASMAACEARKRELFRALQTRVLTDEEMAEVEGHGDDINIRNMEPFFEADKQRERNEAFLQQARLRTTHERTN